MLRFPVTYRGQMLEIEIALDKVEYALREGERVVIRHETETIELTRANPVAVRPVAGGDPGRVGGQDRQSTRACRPSGSVERLTVEVRRVRCFAAGFVRARLPARFPVERPAVFRRHFASNMRILARSLRNNVSRLGPAALCGAFDLEVDCPDQVADGEEVLAPPARLYVAHSFGLRPMRLPPISVCDEPAARDVYSCQAKRDMHHAGLAPRRHR